MPADMPSRSSSPHRHPYWEQAKGGGFFPVQIAAVRITQLQDIFLWFPCRIPKDLPQAAAQPPLHPPGAGSVQLLLRHCGSGHLPKQIPGEAVRCLALPRQLPHR